jgi:tetratricopeptide (TPR) repeat protein
MHVMAGGKPENGRRAAELSHHLVARHEWIIAPFRADREATLPTEVTRFTVDAHRNFRGPYTSASGIIRQLISQNLPFTSELIARHYLTLLIALPELASVSPPSAEIAQLLALSREGFARAWTRRIANGLADFLLDYAERESKVPLRLCFENTDSAEPLDREFLAILLRRADPGQLQIRIGSAANHFADPLGSAARTYASTIRPERPQAWRNRAIPECWKAWLKECGEGWVGERKALLEMSAYADLTKTAPTARSLGEFATLIVAGMPDAARNQLAEEFVSTDCTSESLLWRAAYMALPEEERRAIHLHRARKLEQSNEPSLSFGAIPLNYELAGVNPAGLLTASKQLMDLAYYDSALDWAVRGKRLIASTSWDKLHSDFSRNILFCTLLLGRFPEVEQICEENLRLKQDPALLAHTTYAKAILAARMYEASKRDYEAARRWIENSLSFTAMLPDSDKKVVNTSFLRNTLALVEMKQDKKSIAHKLLSEALDRIATEAPNKYAAESAIFLHNRARLHWLANEQQEAIEDLTTLLRHQPCNSSAYFDRGLIYQRAGKLQEALRDYDSAIRWSPPYPEPYINCAQIFAALGQTEDALRSYSYALQLAPDLVDPLLDRACLLYENGDVESARRDIEAALQLKPTNPRALCLRGLLELRAGNLDAAYQDFSEAISSDKAVADAWANRAKALFKQGRFNEALTDLNEAVRLRADPAILYNRARVLESLQKWDEAIADYERAKAMCTTNQQLLLECTTRCQRANR